MKIGMVSHRITSYFALKFNSQKTTKMIHVVSKRTLPFLLAVFILLGFKSFSQTIIYSQNFNGLTDAFPLANPTGGGTTWNAVYAAGSNSKWAIYNPGLASKCLEMYVGGTDLIYSATQICNVVAYESLPVNASNYTNLTLSFDWMAGGESATTDDYLVPVYSINGGTSWVEIGPKKHNSPAYPTYVSVVDYDISVLDNQSFLIGFRWANDAAAGTTSGPAVDNIVIKGVQPACSGTPDPGTITLNYSTGCSGEDIRLIGLGEGFSADSAGLSYQWQESANGISGWTNLAGQTSPYEMEDWSTTTVYYRLVVTCSNSGLSSSSNVVSYIPTACTDYLIPAAASTITTCLGMFYDSGGDGGNYTNSQNRTITFCSGTTEHIMVDFMMFETQSNGLYGVSKINYDILNVYDGPTTGSPQLFSLSGGSDPNEGNAPLVISSGTCLTFNFTSNGSTVDLGWEAMVSCTDKQNNIASNFCATAPFICNLNGYQGTTTNFYTPQSVGGQIGSAPSSFPGTLDNNSFIKFVPTTATVTLSLEVSNCSGGITSTSGFYEAIQFAVYQQGSGGSCDLGNWVSDYDDVWDGITPGLYTRTLTGLTPGSTYYIVVDGLWGTVCDYKINVLSGISLPTINVDEATICLGDNITLTASGGTSYLWSNGSTAASIVVSAADQYEVIVSSGNPLCPDNTELSSLITVDNCALPVTLTSFTAVCKEDNTKEINWTTASEQNSDYFVLEKSTDGSAWIAIDQVDAATNSTSTLHYQSIDINRVEDLVYYRLKQVDMNGENELFGPISTNCSVINNTFEIYPNPAGKDATIIINSDVEMTQLELQFCDLNGKIVKRLTPNASSTTISLNDLVAGVYFVQLVGDKAIKHTLKFIKQ